MATPASDPAAHTTRLGSGFAKLWAAATVSFVGDGIYSAALPLLAATLTRDPLAVAAVEVASQLPWLLFALPAGALVDRWDRRRVLWLTDAYRALVLTALTVTILSGWASIPLLGAAGFLLAVGGTLFTPATMSILPGLVSREPARLERANSRLAAAQTVGDNFLGPPAGGALFSLAHSVPFAADAFSFAASAALLASIKGHYAPARDPEHDQHQAPPRPSLRREILEGLRWLAGQRLLRTLATMNAITSLVFGAWTAIMVLFAQDRLDLGNVGYGLLWTGVAAGSLLGSLVTTWLSRLLGQRRLLLISAATFGATTLGIGTSTSPWVAGGLLAVLGLTLTAWNVVVISLRQAITPDRLVGRINSTFQLLSFGMLPLGAALGGVLGRSFGLRAPFLIGGVALLVMALAAIPIITSRAIENARASVQSSTPPP